jgi:hypothetical protein
MYKLIFSFNLVCPLSSNFINALLCANVPFTVTYNNANMLVNIKPKYAMRALYANFSLCSVALPAPVVINNGYLFNIS